MGAVAQALYILRVQSQRLTFTLDRVKERDEMLFEKVVQAQMEGDTERAALYAAEAAELRKLAKRIATVRYAVERLISMLEDAAFYHHLAPDRYAQVIRDIGKIALDLVPDIGLDILAAADLLGAEPGEYSEEARKVMEKAAAEADHYMMQHYPPLPSTYPSRR